jgi:hypothetical protein
MFEVGVEPAGVVDGVQEVNPVRRAESVEARDRWA